MDIAVINKLVFIKISPSHSSILTFTYLDIVNWTQFTLGVTNLTQK